MNPRILIYVLATLLAGAATAYAEPQAALQVHLPRTVAIGTDALALGAISVLRADDQALARKAADIPMGRAPWSGETIAIDRPTILGRLAAHGIAASKVRLTGAEKVLVGRAETVLKVERLVKQAEALLAQARPGPVGCRWRLLRKPDSLAVPDGVDVRLAARLVPHAVEHEAKVEVAAMAGEKRLGEREVVFHRAYPQRLAVATREVPAGTPLLPENTEIRTGLADEPQATDWTPPYGQLAARDIPAGSVILPHLVARPTPRVAVRRNEAVVMRIRGDGFMITGIGQALEDGATGDYVKVRNADSRRVVVAKVALDGTVEPVFNGAKQ